MTGDRDQQQAAEPETPTWGTVRRAAFRAAEEARAEEAARWRAKIEALADSLIRDARTDRSTVVWIAEQFRAAVAALDPKEQADE